MEGWTNSSSSEWMYYPDPLLATGTRKNQLQQYSKKLGQSCEGPAQGLPPRPQGKIRYTAQLLPGQGGELTESVRAQAPAKHSLTQAEGSGRRKV